MDDKELVRCPWAGIGDTEYARYHDEEWGCPQHDDRALFEKLVLEGFQSGLSWLTILRKRDNFRRLFDNFEPAAIARYGPADVARLMAEPGIVRNRLKIEATIDNARAYLKLAQTQTLASLLWGMIGGRPIVNAHVHAAKIPAETELSRRMSKELKSRGFRFVGPTTLYAFMQATGMVNDHLVSCHRYAPCAALQHAFHLSPTPAQLPALT